MPKPRSALISLDDTRFYHCVSRCVRRAFLCGVDELTGQDYSERRQAIEDRLLQLGTVFAIDIAAYAIMSNHHHEVLHVDLERAARWTDAEVIERWHKLYNGLPVGQAFLRGEKLSQAEMDKVTELAARYRDQLTSISWFMRALNEPIARQANKEDGCTGKFFESRFKSNALLDEQALLACMAYVDLNPVRAAMADTPEASDHTSIQRRIRAAEVGSIPKKLMRFQGAEHRDKPDNLIPFALKDYVELVDTTGRLIRSDKRGAIDPAMPPILKRLKIDTDTWLDISQHFEQHFGNWVGSSQSIRQIRANNHTIQRIRGAGNCRSAFG